MPIIMIWNAQAAPFEKWVKRWLKEMTIAAGGLGSWLGKRLSEGAGIEQMTRGFVVFRFYNLALSARVVTAQHGTLLTLPVPGLGSHFRAIGAAWRVDRVIADRAREAGLIGRLMRALEQMVGGALTSIDRFASPVPQMFDPRGGQASDLIGLGALAFRALGRGRDGIQGMAQRIERALRSPPPEKPPTEAGVQVKPPEPPPALPLSMRLDEGLRYIAGALLILPAAGALFVHMGRDILLWLRHLVLDKVLSLETMVLDMRQSTLTGIRTGLATISLVSVKLFGVAQFHVVSHIRHWTGFGVAYLRGLATGVADFADQLRHFFGGAHDAVQLFIDFSAAVMAIDLTQVVQNVLATIQQAIEFIDFNFYAWNESPRGYTAPGTAIRVTLGELALAEGAGVTARDQMALGASRLQAAAAGASGLNFNLALGSAVSDMNLFGMIRGVQLLLPELGQRPPGPVSQPTLRFSATAMPDLVALIISPLRNGLNDAVQRGALATRSGIGRITTGAVDMLDGAADRFHRGALGAVRLGGLRHLRRIIADSEGLVARAFPGPVPEAPTGLERVGAGFSLWFVGQFETLGRAIGGYLGFVLDEWRAHLDASADTVVEVTATSPRILLRRAQLGRVHLQTMRITAHGGLADAELAARVAVEFRGAVGRAYARGHAQFRALPGVD